MDHYLQLLKRQASTGDPEAMQRYIHALERALGGVSPSPPIFEDLQYGPEAVIQTVHGTQLRCPPYPQPVDYIRVCDEYGEEIAYWNVDEWRAAPESGAHYDPHDGDQESMEVIGAIVGALLGGRSI